MYKKIYKSMCVLSILTLILTALMILSVCYSVFISKYEEELQSEVNLISDVLNSHENPAVAFKYINASHQSKRMLLINTDGTVLFDNNPSASYTEDYTASPEIISAKSSGEGFLKKDSISTLKTHYYFAKKLNNGMIFRLATSTQAFYSLYINVLTVVFFLISLIYIFTIIIAMMLTNNIVKPIENMYNIDDESVEAAYDEIKPFLNRIIKQNREIKRHMEKIKNQKFRLETITDNMNEGLIIIDKDTYLLSLNDYTAEIFNVSTLYYKQRKFNEIIDNQDLYNCLVSALDGKKNDVITEVNSKTFQAFSSPVFTDTKISGVIMILFDISAKAESEKIRREFSANVSHELKTPLTSIHGYAQVISSGIAKPEDIGGFAKKIEKESSRLIYLIDDIMKLSKLDEKATDENKQDLSLKTVISEVCEMLSKKAEEKNIKININGTDTILYANISQLTELVYNFIDNAIKYNKQDGEIFISIYEKQLTIRDTGIGIPAKYLDRIFERFFRVDKSHSKKVNGTGLGLSIVKHIAQSMNATISVQSKIDVGTTFTIKFSE